MNTLFVIHYNDDVVMLFNSGVDLQKLMNKLYELGTSSSLDVNMSKTQQVKAKRHFT